MFKYVLVIFDYVEVGFIVVYGFVYIYGFNNCGNV